MKKIIILMCLLVLSVSAAAQSETPGFTCPEGQAEVVVAAGAVGIELRLAQDAAARFTALCPDIIVTPLEMASLATDRVSLYISFLGSQSPLVDIYQMDIVNVGALAEHFVDLRPYLTEGYLEAQFPSIVETGIVNDQVLALPWLIDTGHLYYRTDLLDKYGIDVPTTWDELEAAALTIQEGERAEGNNEFWGYVWQGAIGEGLTTNALEWQVSEGGGRIIGEDGSIQVNNPETVAALERAQNWIGVISPDSVLGQAEEDARGIWQAGNAAFMRNWFYAYSLGNSADSPIAGKFDITTLPAGNGGVSAATLGGQMLAVSKYSDTPEAARAVALYFASEAEQRIRAIEGSLNPTFMELYQDPELIELYPAYPRLFEAFSTSAAARPSVVAGELYNNVSSYYFTAVHQVLRGETDAQTAMEYLELDLEDLIAGL